MNCRTDIVSAAVAGADQKWCVNKDDVQAIQTNKRVVRLKTGVTSRFQERGCIIIIIIITSRAKEDTTNLTAIDPKPKLNHRHASYHLAAILDETRR